MNSYRAQSATPSSSMHNMNPHVYPRPLAIPFSLMAFSRQARTFQEPELEVEVAWSCSNRQPVA